MESTASVSWPLKSLIRPISNELSLTQKYYHPTPRLCDYLIKYLDILFTLPPTKWEILFKYTNPDYIFDYATLAPQFDMIIDSDHDIRK